MNTENSQDFKMIYGIGGQSPMCYLIATRHGVMQWTGSGAEREAITYEHVTDDVAKMVTAYIKRHGVECEHNWQTGEMTLSHGVPYALVKEAHDLLERVESLEAQLRAERGIVDKISHKVQIKSIAPGYSVGVQ